MDDHRPLAVDDAEAAVVAGGGLRISLLDCGLHGLSPISHHLEQDSPVSD